MLFLWEMMLVRMADGTTTKPLHEVRAGDVLFRDVRVGIVVRRRYGEGPLAVEYYLVEHHHVHTVTWDGNGALEIAEVVGAKHWAPMHVQAPLIVEPTPLVVALPDVDLVPVAWRHWTALVRWRADEEDSQHGED